MTDPTTTPSDDAILAELAQVDVPAFADGPRIELVGEIPPKIAAGLVKAQSTVGTIEKTGRNTAHSYDYGKMEDLIEGGKKALNDAGLALIPGDLGQARFVVSVPMPETKATKAYVRHVTNYDLVRRWMLIHEAGAVLNILIVWPMFLQGGKRARDKGVSAADTTALGYLYRDLLSIPRLAGDQMDARDDTGTTEAGQADTRKPLTKPTPKPSEPTCKTGKRGYASKTAAKRANSKNAARLRFYRCDDCRQWHATQPEKVPAEAKASGKAAAKSKAAAKPAPKGKGKGKDKGKADAKPAAKPKADASPADSKGEDKPGDATMVIDGEHVAGPAPTADPPAEPTAEAAPAAEEPAAKVNDSKGEAEADAKPEVVTGTGEGGSTKRGMTKQGQTYGETADAVAEQQRAELTDEELDAEVVRALKMGLTPSTTNDAIVVELPADPSVDDLEGAGWPREIAEELANYADTKPVKRKELNAITRKASDLLGYEKMNKEAKAILIPAFLDVGVDVKKAAETANGYQLRLWALAVATIANSDEEPAAV